MPDTQSVQSVQSTLSESVIMIIKDNPYAPPDVLEQNQLTQSAGIRAHLRRFNLHCRLLAVTMALIAFLAWIATYQVWEANPDDDDLLGWIPIAATPSLLCLLIARRRMWGVYATLTVSWLIAAVFCSVTVIFLPFWGGRIAIIGFCITVPFVLIALECHKILALSKTLRAAGIPLVAKSAGMHAAAP
jgi:hypothetical protein